jgi:organic radical activating enzyme
MGVEYGDNAQTMRDRLNVVSPTLCLAKWLQVSLHLPQGRTQSCYHPPTHPIPLEQLKENPGVLHNTPLKILEREQMMQGERPTGCSYCWRIEDAKSDDPKGHLSDRHYRSSEWWAENAFEEISSSGSSWSGSPRYVEVNFNQSCNFKCMYCSPHLSTTWHEEIEKHGPYKLFNYYKHNDITELDKQGLMPLNSASKENPYVNAFWEWWPSIYRKLRVFRMTGGEPLMDNNTFKIMDYVNENPHGHLELSITSNMCPPSQKLFEKFISKIRKLEELRTYEDKENFNEFSGNHWYVDKGFKHFWLYVSLDGYGKQAEYMRNGLEFERMIGNVRTFLRETKYSTVSFINTFNMLSIPSLHKFLELILELRREFGGRAQSEFIINPEQTQEEKENNIIHKVYTQKKFQRVFFDIPLLRSPVWFQVQNSGEYGIQEVERCLKFMEENVQGDDYSETFEGFKPYEILKLKRDLAVMKESVNENQLELNKINFLLYIKEMDKRRGTNFIETFPELTYYWEDCIKTSTQYEG